MVEKQGQKIWAGVSPPPLFGQCPKENIFFFVRASLIVMIEVTIKCDHGHYDNLEIVPLMMIYHG